MDTATIGLIGVVVGALLGALLSFFREKSADKRRWQHEEKVQDEKWERERQDQQQQWQREDKVRQQQWERENQLRNHEQRLGLYTEFLALGTAGDLGRGLKRASTTKAEERREAIENVKTDNVKAGYLLSSIRLLAPEDVYEAAKEFAVAAETVRMKRAIEYGELRGLDIEIEGHLEDVKHTNEEDLMCKLVKAERRFLEVAREEPGFE